MHRVANSAGPGPFFTGRTAHEAPTGPTITSLVARIFSPTRRRVRWALRAPCELPVPPAIRSGAWCRAGFGALFRRAFLLASGKSTPNPARHQAPERIAGGTGNSHGARSAHRTRRRDGRNVRATERVMLGPVDVACAVRSAKNGHGPSLFATRCMTVRSSRVARAPRIKRPAGVFFRRACLLRPPKKFPGRTPSAVA